MARALVRFCPSRECFVSTETGKAYRGLAKGLRRVFFPDYRLQRNRDTSAPAGAPVGANGASEAGAAPVPGQGGGAGSSLVGRARGRRVDREMDAWIAAGSPRVVSASSEDARARRFARAWHPYTLRIIGALGRLGLVGVATQVPVCDPSLRIATAVDLLCRHRATGTWVVCEIKCGFNGTVNEDATGQMREPLAQVTNCPRNQHQLQLACTESMLMRQQSSSFRRLGRFQSCVIRAGDDGVHFEKLEDWARRAVPQVMREIAGA